MLISDPDFLKLLPFLAPPLLLSLTVHEFAHARMALAFGDPTALRAGRVTLNPLKHLDPIGTIALFLVGFGWAKPVPVNPSLLRPPGLGNVMVTAAGPLSNLLMASVAGMILRVLYAVSGGEFTGLQLMVESVLMLTISINFLLMIFNFIPLKPLDGHHILGELLPAHMRTGYAYWQAKYGSFVLLILLFGPRFLTMMSGKYVQGPISWLLGKGLALADWLFIPY